MKEGISLKMQEKKEKEIEIPKYKDYRSKRRFAIFFSLLRPIFRLFTFITLHYKAIPFHTDKQNYVIISNHTGPLDPVLIALSFKRPIFFLANKYVFRNRFLRRIIKFIAAPIPISKTRLDINSLRQVKHIVDHGHTIAFFPSGNRSVSGPEQNIPKASSKLLKLLKRPVLIYRIEGGYLSTPIWGRFWRRGIMSGEVVIHLSAEEIQEIPAEELDRMLYQFCDANPYLPSRDNKMPYYGIRRAEYLERILWICPSCKKRTSLYSHKNNLKCACGFNIRYEDIGRFVPASWNQKDERWAKRFPHVDAMYQWQKRELRRTFTKTYLDTLDENEMIFQDQNERLYLLQSDKYKKYIAQGSLALYKDRLVFQNLSDSKLYTIKLDNIIGMSYTGKQNLQITDKNGMVTYQFRTKLPRSADKYIQLISHMQKLYGTKPAKRG